MEILILGSSAETTLPRVENGQLAEGEINKSKDLRDQRQRTCTAIKLPDNQYLLFDATPEIWEQLERYNLTGKIKYIFITHPHKDRIGGLFSRFIDIKTFAIKNHWQYLEKSLIAYDKREILDKNSISLDNLVIKPFPVYHGKSTKFLVTGYQVLNNLGQCLIYLPEVRNIPRKVRPKLMGADIMIMDGSSFYFATDWHASIQEQLNWVAEYKPKKVFFTHIGYKNPPHEELEQLVKDYNKNGGICYDGQVLTLLTSNLDMKNLISKNFNYKTADDTSLLSAHSQLHSLFEYLEKGKSIENWTQEEVISLHKNILNELHNRDICHYLEDSLDRHTVNNLRGKTLELVEKLNLSKTLTKNNIKEHKNAYVAMKCVSDKGDQEKIEVVIKDDVRNVLLENKIASIFDKNDQKKLSFIYDELGPDESYIPLFDLKLVSRKNVSPVLIDPKVSTLINISKRIEPLTAKNVTADPREFFAWADRNLGDGLIIQGKIAGVRTTVHKDLADIKIYLDNAEGDQARLMKEFVDILEEIEADNFIFDGYLTTTSGVDMVKQVSQIGTPDEPTINGEELKFAIHDVLYYNDRDLHQEPLKYRLEFLNRVLKATPLGVEGVPYSIASNLDQVGDGLNRVFGNFDVDGAWGKIMTSDYPLSGKTDQWYLLTPNAQQMEDDDKEALNVEEAGDVLVDDEKDPEIQDETINQPRKE